jgi:recombinational DNA repair protein RecR
MTRDEKGRFIKGHEKIGGRKSKATEQSYLSIMLDVISEDDFREIVIKARDQAKRGDATARKWISDYILGMPVQRTELSGPDGEPITFIEKVVDVSDSDA